MWDEVYRVDVLHRISGRYIKVGDCWEWQGGLTQFGYGQIVLKYGKRDYRTVTAHRAHWMLHYNVVLEREVQVCHKCDNPRCVNLDHLFLGSAKDNADDKIAKGRHLRHGKINRTHSRIYKYSNETIMAIKLEVGKNVDIAEKYGVPAGYVSELRSGKAKPLVVPEGAMYHYRGMPLHLIPVHEIKKEEKDKRTKYSDEVVEEIRSYAGDWRRRAWELGMSEHYAWRIRHGWSRKKNI